MDQVEAEFLCSSANLYEAASVLRGMSPEEERYKRVQAVRKVNLLYFYAVRVGQNVEDCAATFIHRFYMQQAMQDYPPNAVATAAFFLACKNEEEPHALEPIVYWSQMLDDGKAGVHDPPMLKPTSAQLRTERFLEHKKEVLACETALLQTFGFNVVVPSPHFALLRATQGAFNCGTSSEGWAAIQPLKGRDTPNQREALGWNVMRQAWNVLNDSNLMPNTVLFQPDVLAVAAMLIAYVSVSKAVQTSELELPDPFPPVESRQEYDARLEAQEERRKAKRRQRNAKTEDLDWYREDEQEDGSLEEGEEDESSDLDGLLLEDSDGLFNAVEQGWGRALAWQWFDVPACEEPPPDEEEEEVLRNFRACEGKYVFDRRPPPRLQPARNGILANLELVRQAGMKILSIYKVSEDPRDIAWAIPIRNRFRKSMVKLQAKMAEEVARKRKRMEHAKEAKEGSEGQEQTNREEVASEREEVASERETVTPVVAKEEKMDVESAKVEEEKASTVDASKVDKRIESMDSAKEHVVTENASKAEEVSMDVEPAPLTGSEEGAKEAVAQATDPEVPDVEMEVAAPAVLPQETTAPPHQSKEEEMVVDPEVKQEPVLDTPQEVKDEPVVTIAPAPAPAPTAEEQTPATVESEAKPEVPSEPEPAAQVEEQPSQVEEKPVVVKEEKPASVEDEKPAAKAAQEKASPPEEPVKAEVEVKVEPVKEAAKEDTSAPEPPVAGTKAAVVAPSPKVKQEEAKPAGPARGPSLGLVDYGSSDSSEDEELLAPGLGHKAAASPVVPSKRPRDEEERAEGEVAKVAKLE